MTVINGYRLVTDFKTAGGMADWALAEKGGERYFIKRFSKYKYPLDSSPGSEANKAKRRAVCKRFEARHLAVDSALTKAAVTGSNVVIPLEFFRHETFYYKVSPHIDIARHEDISTLGRPAQFLLLKTIARAMEQVHGANVVHGDLKPQKKDKDGNIIVEIAKAGPVGKLIDFDDSFLAHDLPTRTELMGDAPYYSPEMLRYLEGDPHARIDVQSDIFALGVIFTEYLTGSLPDHGRWHTCAQAVAAGESIDPGLRKWTQMRALILAMTAPEPSSRPTAGELLVHLKTMEADPGYSVSPRSVRAAPTAGASAAATGGSKLRGSLLRTTLKPTTPTGGTSAAPRPTATGETATPTSTPAAAERPPSRLAVSKNFGRAPKKR
ncbi:serine/threonine protein kinase [Dietzia cinnamea]|uniref:serine/threonine protein kinase n=1 Tax=Dietzia cinnamea TaxID=321318 RepID=UPI0021AFB5DC|nr:protein kinase [Dietzia cinnamea]MCT2173216.1 protein kinase [Dietzia cinnamea]